MSIKNDFPWAFHKIIKRKWQYKVMTLVVSAFYLEVWLRFNSLSAYLPIRIYTNEIEKVLSELDLSLLIFVSYLHNINYLDNILWLQQIFQSIDFDKSMTVLTYTCSGEISCLKPRLTPCLLMY